MEIKMNALRGLDIAGKKILFRPDINSPIDPVTKKIVNENRLKKNAVTLKYMLENGAAVALIAHQGDTQDYQNLIPLEEHAEKLSDLTDYPVHYIDDVCGPAAIEAVKNLPAGEAIILGNLRYLGEELSTFSNFVKLKPEDMGTVWHIRKLSPLFDLYVNDAFSAAHRDAPSMVGFPHFLPAAAGFQFFDEYAALASVKDGAEHPCMFVLGGAKISDAFGMMESVLKNGTADKILTTGVTGIIMHIANGVTFGEPQMKFLRDRDMLSFVDAAKKYLTEYPDRFEHVVEERSANFSGGQQQRLSIARGIIGKPKVLILDDSTSALDAESEKKVQAGLEQKLGDATVFIIAEKIFSVMHADKILVMDDGKIKAMGTHEELLLTSPLYQEIYETQRAREGGI